MEKIKIAICGGGIASLCLAHALIVQHSQWEVHVFEASAEPRNESAAIGLEYNSQLALSLISTPLGKALKEAKGVRISGSRRMMGTGKDAGRHLGDTYNSNNEKSPITVHRGMLSEALFSLLPDGTVQFGKRLVSAEKIGGNASGDAPGSVTLRFEDGTTYEADALIGCDGINSVARSAVLGQDHSAVAPISSDDYSLAVVVPIEQAKEAFGDEYCRLHVQYTWIGDGGVIITDFNNDGKAMQVIAGFAPDEEGWPYPEPWAELSKEKLEQKLLAWGDVGKAATKIFLAQPKIYAARGRVHPYTHTYYNGNMCLAGDAAQTFGPAVGAGAGQAIEDALMLSTVLGACNNRESIPKAFGIYDELRRPRRAKIAEMAAWAMTYLTGRAPGIGVDFERLAENLLPWGYYIAEHDLVAEQAEALRRMKQEVL